MIEKLLNTITLQNKNKKIENEDMTDKKTSIHHII